MSANASRLSFAKVAASAGKDNVSLNPYVRINGSNLRDHRNDNRNLQQNQHALAEMNGQLNGDLSNNKITSNEKSQPAEIKRTNESTQTSLRPEASDKVANLAEAVKALNFGPSPPGYAVNGSDVLHRSTANNFGEIIDSSFQRLERGTEFGSKPSAFDKNSIAFSVDEKEYSGHDNCAVSKPAEDIDSFPGRGHLATGLRMESEIATAAHLVQLHEVPECVNFSNIQEHHHHQVTSIPKNGTLEKQTMEERNPKTISVTPGVPEGFNLFYRQTPDDKLLEALDSVKDRIFLLRLEQDVIEFVRSSKEPFIDLPPCNSFCRMLTHKLADYYHMTHQVDAVAGAVRIFRTPFCRLPPSLTSLSNPPASGNTPPPTTMKIMRRGGDSGPSPSKALSESGSDGKEKGLSAKEKLSREEREAAYNKARERIFGKDEKNGEATPVDTEEGNEMSRSSSVSTKDRTSHNKRSKPLKQRRDDSENFDSRSQYTPFFPQPQGPTWIPSAQYSPIGTQSLCGNNRNYQNPVSPQYSTAPIQQLGSTMITTSGVQIFNYPQYPTQATQSSQNAQRFPQNPQINPFVSPVQSPPPPPQPWSQALYQNPYQQLGPTTRGTSNSIPYPFGQLPGTTNPADSKSQHPIPGSFNRHAFNPKTQSFVPGSVGVNASQQTSHNGPPHHAAPIISSPRPSFNTFNVPQQQFSNGMGYNMTRQSSNSYMPPYQVSPLMSHRPLMHHGMPQVPPQGMSHGIMTGIPQNIPQGMSATLNGQIGNHLPNYGNSSTLPPKPPTGI
ncbi:BgTH12-00588 [Blumeria graminis f. sp. triticale]|uniref:BgTH12-00588 n=1 Tax=Blumeria graminis f. sp. triticale TaxID=1689686 RepID=A0A9W4D5C2_BLUGR|nr:BgTH12-00588 [Blumeria graminis f. sp. triticale]